MSDDSFIREVNEDLREDQFKAFWARYGMAIIAVAVLVIAATGGYRYWQYYTQQQAAASGDAFMEAISLSADGKNDEAIKNLEALVEEGSGQYPALAKMRIAAELADSGEAEKAIAAYDAIAADSAFVDTFRNIAKLRAGLIMVDSASYLDVATRLESLAGSGQPFRHTAREALGLSAYKNGDLKQALSWFQNIADDVQSPSGARTRANIMLDLLAGQGVKSETETS